MEILSGVNYKHLIIAAGLALITLTACSEPEFDNRYNVSELSSSDIVTLSDSDFKAKGFASDLCVAYDAEPYNADGINASGYALFDLDGKNIISKNNIFEQFYPASTTKILTCLIALERGNLDDMVTVPNESAITVSGSSMADLNPGDVVRLGDLLYGLMVPSGNDAAVAIAHYIAGNESNFAEIMNQRVSDLGATGSHFVNSNGLPDQDHYTTVYDMYLIFNEALKHEEFRKIASTKEYTATVTGSDGVERELTWTSGNGFLSGKYSLPDGFQFTAGKTGHTNAAGFCLVMGEHKADGHQYVSIVFKSPIYEQLYAGMKTLISKANG